MNVKALKEAIFYFPDDMLVLLAKDEEGNGYAEAEVVDQSCYDRDGHEIWLLDDDEAEEDAPLALVIWP